MEKYFIADDFFRYLNNGLYCINGYGNTDKLFFVTSLSVYEKCDHLSCCGDILEIKKDYSLKVEIIGIKNLAAGDVILERENFKAIILLYDENDIISIIPSVSNNYLDTMGNDCKFLITCLAKNHCLKLQYHNFEKSNINGRSNNEQKSRLVRLCQRSYLYRWLQSRVRDVKHRDIKSVLSSMILEWLLAILLVTIISSYIPPHDQYDSLYVTSTINTLVKLLQDLLTWLMGVPVGLKLNRQFSKVLGQFYLFHVSIWENYMLSSVEPMMPFVLTIVPFLTPLGLSFFICVALDLSAVVTLHLTCFYIYACKLYRLQVIILCSLYRLFHGQKWNPFRARVDTGPSELDRLFTSTLILALSVFLLPTTGLYYLIFASIELVLLLHEYLLSGLVHIIHLVPVLDIVTWLLNRPRHRKLVHIAVLSQSSTSLILSIKLLRSPLRSILQPMAPQDIPLQPQLKIRDIISSLVRGNLLKRW